MKQTLDDWLKWQETLHTSEIDLGLDRIRQVANNLNLLNPLFPIITVAGTNGKGSSVALLESILIAQGYITGSYTSPHLLSYNERIKLNAINASDQQIIDSFKKIDKARGKITLSYFEFGTLAAILLFKKQNVDVAILEVGLGGRLDAANLWDTSLAIITSIAIDHETWLGNNREVIAKEKSGIMRHNSPVISGDFDPPKTIKSEAHRVGAHLYQINTDFSFKIIDGQSWEWVDDKTRYILPHPSLNGDFQLNNAATVIAGLHTIQQQLPTSIDAIKKGLLNASIIGRLQIINENPEWLIDVAHNPHSAKALSKHMDQHPSSGKTYALFSMLKDKDIQKVLAIMEHHIDEWHIVEIEGSRGLSLVELKIRMKKASLSGNIISHDNFSKAIENLKKRIKNKDKVVAFGSFLVVSQVMENWEV
ncbi:MAG: bifunctional tetrahydrofolate synthase/dihydrofolate synthase [Cocleimonas sp.]